MTCRNNNNIYIGRAGSKAMRIGIKFTDSQLPFFAHQISNN